jgi:hypothetical protein
MIENQLYSKFKNIFSLESLEKGILIFWDRFFNYKTKDKN